MKLITVNLTASGCAVDHAVLAGSDGDLPIALRIQLPGKGPRRFCVYIWTIGHGGRTRPATEYRIQTKLRASRRLEFGDGATVLLGYYSHSLDALGRSLGNQAAAEMEVFVAWNPLVHLSLGESSSCQVSFGVMRHAYLCGTADATRQCGYGVVERVLAFRPEYLAHYLSLTSDGINQDSASVLLPNLRRALG